MKTVKFTADYSNPQGDFKAGTVVECQDGEADAFVNSGCAEIAKPGEKAKHGEKAKPEDKSSKS